MLRLKGLRIRVSGFGFRVQELGCDAASSVDPKVLLMRTHAAASSHERTQRNHRCRSDTETRAAWRVRARTCHTHTHPHQKKREKKEGERGRERKETDRNSENKSAKAS